MITALLLASLAAGGAQGGCADHWAVALNRESFASNGAGKTFSAVELEAFRAKIEAQLRSAIGDACEHSAVKPAAVKAVRRVEVSSASGASDPFLYQAVDGTLRFEWVFAEEDLAVPPAKDIVAGMACWTDPNGKACNSPGD
ncbi:MAG TPA: hypothetical protein VFH89_10570 [Sphingomicrobium sp.]|nr:hypothetical protein [Sphingomicrobium sp.]